MPCPLPDGGPSRAPSPGSEPALGRLPRGQGRQGRPGVSGSRGQAGCRPRRRAYDLALACLAKAPDRERQPYLEKRRQFAEREDEAWQEVFSTPVVANAEALGLALPDIKRVAGVLLRQRRITSPWVLRKQVSVFPGRPYFLLLVSISGGDADAIVDALVQQVSLPGPFVVVPEKDDVWSAKDIGDVAGPPIYRRR